MTSVGGLLCVAGAHRRPTLLPRHYSLEPLRCLRVRHGLAAGLEGRSSRGHRSVVFAQRKTETDKQPSRASPASATSKEQEEEEFPSLDSKWGLFNGKAYLQGWQVPWGGKELALGMVGWAVSFVLVGVAFIPVAKLAAGPQGFAAMPQMDKAYFALANQVLETIVGLGVIRAAVRTYEPLPDDVFKLDWRQPFTAPNGWLLWGLIGICLAPLAVLLTSVAVESAGYNDLSGRGTVDAVSSIISLDGPTYAALFTTTAVLAPLLEETVFRGFLLTTLTKWMPIPAAVLLSSLAFGTAHFTPRDFPQLTTLGVLLGISYVRSRNLLTPMLIHGAWNGTVLSLLFLLTSYGVDIQKVIHEGL